MNTIQKITTQINSFSIQMMENLETSNQIQLSPYYQRGEVWTFKQKVYLIDSILQGFPLPKFYMHVKRDKKTGKYIHEAIDGKQRLTTIFEFINGKTNDGKAFILSAKNHPKPETFNEALEGKAFIDLTESELNAFMHYRISIEEITSETSDELVQDMFTRLNSSASQLTKQELRNAQYHGDFKQMVVTTAKDMQDNIKTYGVLAASAIKRLGHHELVAEIYTAMMYGLQDKKHELTNIYAENEQMDKGELDALKKRFKNVKNVINDIFDGEIKLSRFNKKNDFYSLFYAIYDLKFNKGCTLTREHYPYVKESLMNLTREVKDSSTSFNQDMMLYAEGVINSGDILKARIVRDRIIKQFIGPFFTKKDELVTA